MGNKNKDHKSSFFEKKEEKKEEKPVEKTPTPPSPSASRPMRRKNKILGDGKDWFDTHPDA
jgi:hypothetical protein